MKLPFVENALIAPAKITEYLLSETHESGKDKAAFFLHFGFSVAQWEVMGDALLAHAAAYEVFRPFSVINGSIPDGRNVLRPYTRRFFVGTQHAAST